MNEGDPPNYKAAVGITYVHIIYETPLLNPVNVISSELETTLAQDKARLFRPKPIFESGIPS
jgi:hypothetical protein